MWILRRYTAAFSFFLVHATFIICQGPERNNNMSDRLLFSRVAEPNRFCITPVPGPLKKKCCFGSSSGHLRLFSRGEFFGWGGGQLGRI